MHVSKIFLFAVCSIPTSVFFSIFFWRIYHWLPFLALSPVSVPYCSAPSLFGGVSQNTNTHKSPTLASKMRLIYNPGGIGHARKAQRVQDRAFKRQSYSSGEKMKIVHAVDKMLVEENITLGVAAARLGVHRNNLASWTKNKTALSDSLVENRLSLHKGPMSILEDIKDELLEFITH